MAGEGDCADFADGTARVARRPTKTPRGQRPRIARFEVGKAAQITRSDSALLLDLQLAASCPVSVAAGSPLSVGTPGALRSHSRLWPTSEGPHPVSDLFTSPQRHRAAARQSSSRRCRLPCVRHVNPHPVRRWRSFARHGRTRASRGAQVQRRGAHAISPSPNALVFPLPPHPQPSR